MPDNDINIKVTMEEAYSKAKSYASELATKGAFKSQKGAQAQTKLEGLLTVVEKLIKEGELTEDTTKNLKQKFSEITSIITTYATRLGHVSEQTQKLQKTLDNATKKADIKRDALKNTQKDRVNLLSDLSKAIQGTTKITGLNKGRKYSLQNVETISEYYQRDPKSLTFEGSSEKQLANITTILESIKAKNQTIKEQKEEVRQAEIRIDSAKVALEKSINEDKLQGGGRGSEVIGETINLQQQTNKTLDSFVTNKNNEDNAQIIKDADASLSNLNTTIDKNNSSLGKAFKQFSIYAIALKSIKTAARAAVSTIKELDRSLTEQAMVTGRTREQTYALLKSYQDLAKSTGSTTKEIAELATQFMRQGKTAEDSLVLTEAAMSAAKVAGISATDSVNYLTTALNGFRLSAEDAILVSDKFASIAANAATSYDEIAIALSKVAAQANLAGMSIDYTTALLAKGLETTREAPETIGTALKTIIARMRELSDYGETLGGDTDINNVESQLAYVGIALRDANGELRSTEEVLDELGRKWETLNSNQQAAIAKALAGTRQQSRLIAMMSDYERVIELQEIAERSQGATVAQMATYLEGMDAALNRVSIAWETIVTNIANNEVFINLINTVAGVLDGIGGALENSFITMTALSAIVLIVVGNKMKEWMIAKQLHQIQIDTNKKEREQNKLNQEAVVLAKKDNLERLKALKTSANEILLKKDATTVQKQIAKQTLATIDAEIAQAETELVVEEEKLNLINKQNEYLNNQDSLVGKLQTGFSGLTAPLFVAITFFKTIIGLTDVLSKKRRAQHKATMAEAAAENKINATNAAGKIISQLGLWGIPIAVGVVAALASLVFGISAIIKNAHKNSAEGTAEEVNKLSNEIYKLENKARALETINKSYKDLDNQIIKTQKDQEKMNELLDQAADKLSDEEKQYFNSLQSNSAKQKYLESVIAKSREEANTYRQEQLNKVNNLSGSERTKFLDASTTDSEILTAQAAIYAINNQRLYEHIDKLSSVGTVNEGVQKVTEALLDTLSPEEALRYANNPTLINELADSLNNLKGQYQSLADVNHQGSVTEVLTSDDYSIVDKVKAYNEALNALTGDMKENFKEAYSDLAMFATFSDEVLNFIDNSGITVEGINNIAKAIQGLGYSAEKSARELATLFENLENGYSIQDAIIDQFGLDITTDEGAKQYNKILKSYADATGQGILNMGQNITTLQNTIDSFYENIMKWSEMSAKDRTEFMADHSDLFAGEDGSQLLEALNSQDYNRIYEALSNNENLNKKVAAQIKAIEQEILLEEAKLDGDRNEAWIAQLKQDKAMLEDVENFYAASLDVRLEQEQKYLDEYKSYLEKQKDALQESLEKRKDAYSDYFEKINQKADDEDFENKENTLIANISKLATSGSASAINQQAKLEEELAQLQKERIEELRQRAQDAILENIDDEISEINDKFDKLLNSQQALLAAMSGELNDPSVFLSKLITNKVQEEGLTELGLESYLRDLQSIYGSQIGSQVFDETSVEQRGDQLVLNIAGKEIVLSDTNQQTIYTAIMTALQQIGIR